jgi:hypothetical protein
LLTKITIRVLVTKNIHTSIHSGLSQQTNSSSKHCLTLISTEVSWKTVNFTTYRNVQIGASVHDSATAAFAARVRIASLMTDEYEL